MLATLLAAQLGAGSPAMACRDLEDLPIENAAVTAAEPVEAGVFEPPGRGSGAPPQASGAAEPIPAHCRVTMQLTPTPESDIHVELWLPAEQWNGKFLAVGNGGWAGMIQGYGDMQEALRRGYATAGTDTGHAAEDGPAGTFALGNPEKLVDFAYRAVHEMTRKSKLVADMYYARPVDYSYFKGCSTGGRQAVMSAQRYPGDFDGIIAGALANRHINMHVVQSNQAIELSRHPERAISEAQAELVNDYVLEQCDTHGDGFLNDPQACSVDFSALECTSGTSSEQCLTPPQVSQAERYYGDTYNEDGELIFSGQALGSPLPAQPSTNEMPTPFLFDTIRILGFQDPDYDWRDFDLERDLPRIQERVGFVDAVDPDLRAFKAHGGKLLMYAGWQDTAITPRNTVLYRDRVIDEMGPGQDEWMRLFMVPGMGHCRGGDGPHTFDTISVLEQWREGGEAPESIPGSNPASGLERPLCPYPEVAEHDGSGDLNDASSWSCAAP